VYVHETFLYLIANCSAPAGHGAVYQIDRVYDHMDLNK